MSELVGGLPPLGLFRTGESHDPFTYILPECGGALHQLVRFTCDKLQAGGFASQSAAVMMLLNLAAAAGA